MRNLVFVAPASLAAAPDKPKNVKRESERLAKLRNDPNITQTKVQGITFYIPKNYDLRTIDFNKIVGRVVLLNSYMPNSCQVTDVELIAQGSSQCITEHYTGGCSLLRINAKTNEFVMSSINHEMGHAIYQHVISQNPELKNEWTKLYMKVMAEQLFGLLDESNYFAGMPGEYGHPFSGPSELFASIFSINFEHRDMLEERITGYPTAQAAFDFMSAVYGKNLGAIRKTPEINNDECLNRILKIGCDNPGLFFSYYVTAFSDIYLNIGDKFSRQNRDILEYLAYAQFLAEAEGKDKDRNNYAMSAISFRSLYNLTPAITTLLTTLTTYSDLNYFFDSSGHVIRNRSAFYANKLLYLPTETILPIFSRYLALNDRYITSFLLYAASNDQPKFNVLREHVETLLLKYMSEKDDQLVADSAECLGYIGNARTVQLLMRTLSSEDGKVIIQTIRALGKIMKRDITDTRIIREKVKELLKRPICTEPVRHEIERFLVSTIRTS